MFSWFRSCAAMALLIAAAFSSGEPRQGLFVSAANAETDSGYAQERRKMVRAIRRISDMNQGPGLPSVLSAPVIDALSAVPRHEFVPMTQRRYAYQDRPLSIGYGQTISQPYIVALMSELARVGAGDRVLEVGTGSGYQAAILAHIGADVKTIEIVPELGARARKALLRAGFANVETRVDDGYFGWPEAAPFNAIVVTAAASHVPPPLIEQLAPGGRMIIPVGQPFLAQQLVLVTKDEEGVVKTRQLLPVMFVPLTRGR